MREVVFGARRGAGRAVMREGLGERVREEVRVDVPAQLDGEAQESRCGLRGWECGMHDLLRGSSLSYSASLPTVAKNPCTTGKLFRLQSILMIAEEVQQRPIGSPLLGT